MSTLATSYLIVGSGVFGASTALQLSKQIPAPSITLVDRLPYPCPIAASYDINKIVRSDYGDIFYCKLGLQTLEKWRNDPLFKKWYHQSGLLKATDRSSELVDKIFQNYKKLGVNVGAELLPPDDLKTKFNGIYADINLTDVDSLLWNPSCGWAEAEYALKDTVKAAVDSGVHYVTASVDKLVFKDGAWTGVLTSDGKTLTASKLILSTGAYTAKLLADSAPTQPELQVGDRITAAGVCEAYVELDTKQAEKFKHVPAFVLDANETQGETMPPTPKGQLKFIRDIPFKHTSHHDASGKDFSVPFTSTERSQWTSPEEMPVGIKDEIATVMKGLYGKELEGLEPSTYRFCWCVTLPDVDASKYHAHIYTGMA